MRSHFTPASVGKKTMRSHLISGTAIACAVTGATALMPNHAAAQSAYDTASNYANGSGGTWANGSTGGYGFGAWSFDSTSSPGGQAMSYGSSIGTGWTLFTTTTSSGISDVGRSITGGLQVGQTFQTLLQNPTSAPKNNYVYYGFDVMFLNATDNLPAGQPSSANPLQGIRDQVFENHYYDGANYLNWNISDNSGAPQTGAAGVVVDLTLNSATSYTLTMTPVGGTAVTFNGTYSGPINYVNYRLYDANASTGASDYADNEEINYMEVVPEPASMALVGLGLAGLVFSRRRK
jgi:hypothetical protein